MVPYISYRPDVFFSTGDERKSVKSNKKGRRLFRQIVVWAGELKGDFEVCVPGVQGYFFDYGLSDIAGKGFFDVAQTIVNVFRRALSNHLNGTVQQVTDPAG